MIGTTLEFIRTYLDGGLRLLMGGSLDDGTASKVMFPPGNQALVDSIAFTSGAVTMLLVNVEEERIFRDADPYRRINDEGRFHEVSHLKEWELAQEWIKKYQDGDSEPLREKRSKSVTSLAHCTNQKKSPD